MLLKQQSKADWAKKLKYMQSLKQSVQSKLDPIKLKEQLMHVGFTSDEGGNTVDLCWFRHKSNLHDVWDREIILTAATDYYDKDINLLQQDIQGNLTDYLIRRVQTRNLVW